MENACPCFGDPVKLSAVVCIHRQAVLMNCYVFGDHVGECKSMFMRPSWAMYQQINILSDWSTSGDTFSSFNLHQTHCISHLYRAFRLTFKKIYVFQLFFFKVLSPIAFQGLKKTSKSCLLRHTSATAHCHTPKMTLRSAIFGTPKSGTNFIQNALLQGSCIS